MKKQASFSMAIGNGELMLDCFPTLTRGNSKKNKNKETEEDSKNKVVYIWKEVQRAKKKVPTA